MKYIASCMKVMQAMFHFQKRRSKDGMLDCGGGGRREKIENESDRVLEENEHTYMYVYTCN